MKEEKQTLSLSVFLPVTFISTDESFIWLFVCLTSDGFKINQKHLSQLTSQLFVCLTSDGFEKIRTNGGGTLKVFSSWLALPSNNRQHLQSLRGKC
jgi:hypothetical protein